MKKMFLYKGDEIRKILEKRKCAILSFSGENNIYDVTYKKADTLDGGISQIKRWISTSSFNLIIIENLSKAAKEKDLSSFVIWLKDHSEDFDGPVVIIKEKESKDEILNNVDVVETEEEIIMNI